MDSQLISQLLLGIVGVIAAAGFVGTVAAFWSMGRAGHRED